MSGKSLACQFVISVVCLLLLPFFGFISGKVYASLEALPKATLVVTFSLCALCLTLLSASFLVNFGVELEKGRKNPAKAA